MSPWIILICPASNYYPLDFVPQTRSKIFFTKFSMYYFAWIFTVLIVRQLGNLFFKCTFVPNVGIPVQPFHVILLVLWSDHLKSEKAPSDLNFGSYFFICKYLDSSATNYCMTHTSFRRKVTMWMWPSLKILKESQNSRLRLKHKKPEKRR